MEAYHEPVLGPEMLELLDPRDGGLYLDGTLGGGSHTRLILETCPDCRVLAVDRDAEAIEHARAALAGFGGRARFLADASEERLAQVFRDFGEEPRARRLAREIVKRRSTETIATSDDLVAALSVALGRSPTARDKARIFQAVRIAVNEELESLERGLPAIREVMNDGAVMVVISYHSLEDRVVKNAFREWSRACVCPPELPVCTCRGRPLGETLTRKPVMPSQQEVERNPRARSARLRAWRRAA